MEAATGAPGGGFSVFRSTRKHNNHNRIQTPRGVAQFGSASVSKTDGCRFEPCHPCVEQHDPSTANR